MGYQSPALPEYDVPPPISGLFCSPEERTAWDHALTDVLQAARCAAAGDRVAPAIGADVFRERLAAFDFQQPHPLTDLIAWAVEQLKQGLVQITHPRYFGLFNPAPSFPSELAERIVAAFNPQLATATTSPAAVEIERHVVRAFATRLGLPGTAGGHFATGGSEANFTALICALTHANGDFADRGITAFGARPVFYVSEEAHLAWYKIAVQCGLGHGGVRLVPSDASGCMVAEALSEMIETDRLQGFAPIMIAATAGTTGAGMIDPLHACADLAQRHGLWFHVDAAWGGAAAVSPAMRRLLDGIERAHSVTIDGHKWLATTMACSLFLVRMPDVLQAAFHLDAHFMPSSDHAVDPYLTTVQWSRRFLGLRLFLALAAVGWQGYAEHVERSVALAELLKAQLLARGWTVPNGSKLAVVCTLPPAGFPAVRDIAGAVLASGKAWISCTRFKGRDVLRICPVNGRTTPRDVLALIDLLEGTRLPGSREKTPEQSLEDAPIEKP